MYRFRSVENLIGKYQELEKQQIYFAAREELNDPLEGTRKYYWKGDKIVWDNFFKHFILCLQHVIYKSRLSKDNKLNKTDIPIFMCEKDIPANHYKRRSQKINQKFFSDSYIQSYLNYFYNNPKKIYFEEMYVHLKILLKKSLDIIFGIDAEMGLIPKLQKLSTTKDETIFLQMINYWRTLDSLKLKNMTFDTIRSSESEYLLIHKDLNQNEIFVEFPQMYLDTVINLTYPNAFIACFMDNCLNSAIWGTYGNNHTGVCLKFKTNEIDPVLQLKTITSIGSGGKKYEYRNFNLKPIEYCVDFEEIDFFKNLGRLPVPQLMEQWYCDDSGNKSICYEDISKNEETWRDEYWGKYERAYFKKLPEWSSEREYRMLLSSSLGTFDDPKDRVLEYKFEDLESIIFGMKTSKEAKEKIIEIIERKCKEFDRDSFDFYEMAYSMSMKEFYPRKILSLTIKN
ncbi:DUF2971 domain-containing protein [Lysinibacillus xylanilyticus]|uniref:DUF2971 domain-containing protein n=1 Tax=Lysinibacillus xylanilyticus TaxID=582475 RepID=UPI003CFEB772